MPDEIYFLCLLHNIGAISSEKSLTLDEIARWTVMEPQRVRTQLDKLVNGAKTVHGGAIFTLADFVFAVASNSHGTMAMGINTSISYVKAALSGTLYAEAEEQSRNSKLATYTVNVADDTGDLVALFQGMVYLKKVPIISTGTPPQA